MRFDRIVYVYRSTKIEKMRKVTEIYKPPHDKTYKKTRATSEDSDQPAHPRSLLRVFADRRCLLQTPRYPKRDKRTFFAILGGCTG